MCMHVCIYIYTISSIFRFLFAICLINLIAIFLILDQLYLIESQSAFCVFDNDVGLKILAR